MKTSQLKKRMPKTYALAMENGLDIVPRKSGHYAILCPNGKMVTVSGSPSCHHADRNELARLRRYLSEGRQAS